MLWVVAGGSKDESRLAESAMCGRWCAAEQHTTFRHPRVPAARAAMVSLVSAVMPPISAVEPEPPAAVSTRVEVPAGEVRDV